MPALVCPRCRGELAEDGTSEPALRCGACALVFPVIGGIADLRLFPDPYISIEDDRAKAARVAERLGDTDFEGLLSFYYSITEVVPPGHARRYLAGLRAAASRAEATLDEWEHQAGHRLAAGTRVLDLGCGTAPLALALARRGLVVTGTDVALRWLIVASKRLEEAGVAIPLICACAEALPFGSAAFDTVAGESVIEVVTDQERSIAEVRRVLEPGGRLWLTTPNRGSLGPDPHIGVPAGGLWPRVLLDRWARSHGAIPPRRRLLTRWSLAALLSRHGFRSPRIFIPGLAPAQLQALGTAGRAAAALYGSVRTFPVAREALTVIGPILGAVTTSGAPVERA